MKIVHGFKILSALSIIFLLLGAPVQAKSHLDSLPDSVKQDLYLLKRLSNNPSLFNAKYLDCYVGPRTAALTAPFSNALRSPAPVFRTFWHDRTARAARYELEYSQPGPSKYLAAFQFILPQQDDLLIEDTSKILETDPQRAFDEEGHVALMYLVEPTPNKQQEAADQNKNIGPTKVFIYQDTHVVNISKVVVQYAGPPPLPPSAVDMEEATTFRRENAFEHHRLGHHDQAQRLLQSHIKAHPDDAEAHLKLAESYKNKSCLNEAITEYKTALSQCGDNSDLRDQCIEGLRSLKVEIPSTTISPTNIPSNVSPTITRERINVSPSNPPSFNNSFKKLEVGF